VLRQAIAARSLTGARDIARVLDARVRRLIEHRPAAARATWADQVPATGDPELDDYLAELAAAMDDRAIRIGEHAARTRPSWVIEALGECPADPADRGHWQQHAAAIGAYRELYGYDSQADAIGPAPAMTSPEAWADWHTAFAALNQIGGIDLREVSDSQLRLRRHSFERELAWAPPYVADELRLARLQARTAWENAIRSEHGERATADPEATSRHRELARTWHALHAKATGMAVALADAHETRRRWAALTEPTRNMALAADLELRRRHPNVPLNTQTPQGRRARYRSRLPRCRFCLLKPSA